MRRFLHWWTFRRLVIAALAASLTISAVFGAAAAWVHSRAAGHIYTVDTVPAAPVVMVLGARVHPDGTPYPFLAARLSIARDLYDSGRARAILVSGDNGQKNYNEVDPMRRWLIDHGVPSTKVVGDYAGFDTYDSCVRARKIFGVHAITVVTQSYHLDRAIALCRHAGIATNGVGDNTSRRYWWEWKKAASREYGADAKSLWDMATNRDPVFLGRHEHGIDRALQTP
jgi:vancomycin permeability regulator SanA